MTDSLTVRDNRTGREYELAITDGTIRAADLKQIAVDGEPGLATYDPGFVNTASCRSAVTFIDGDVGILEYRGYPIERLAEALEVLFILHADHEQNCSTNAVRSVGSSQVDPYSAVAAGVGALYGPLHGGANEAVLRMLKRIGSKENIPAFIEGVKKGKERLMGFGHRVYKNYDPRAKIIKKATDEVFEVTGTNPLLEIALELEKIALEDDYFVKRKLYPNVDFYSGLIYEALGMPVGMFPVLFAIPRTSGWIAQWLEMIDDSEQKIARPRQIYAGERVAVARCVRLPDRPDTAEMAIVVGDPFQGQGLGRALTLALADAAVAVGIRRF